MQGWCKERFSFVFLISKDRRMDPFCADCIDLVKDSTALSLDS